MLGAHDFEEEEASWSQDTIEELQVEVQGDGLVLGQRGVDGVEASAIQNQVKGGFSVLAHEFCLSQQWPRL